MPEGIPKVSTNNKKPLSGLFYCVIILVLINSCMIYLYLKTHNVTGLKYLGKTSRSDPYRYTGSGRRWLHHIKKHGYDVTTEILLESHDPEEIKKAGIYYSQLWDVINNESFANLKLEEGDGGDTSMSSAYKDGIKSRNLTGANNPMYQRSAVIENNLKWYTNGTDTIYVTKGTQPAGFVPGRTIAHRKPHSSETKKKLGRHRKKACVSPVGEIFSSRKEAADAYNVTPEAIGGLIKRGISGWKWL